LMSKFANIFRLSSTDRVRRFYRYLEADKSLGGFGINAIVNVLPEEAALDRARESDARRACNEPLSVIDGALVTAKDTASLPVAGWPTYYGSKHWPTEIDEVDAPIIALLRNAGCLIVGRTAAPEFGWKATTSSLRFNITRSAIDLTRTSGGSSGGAASSVASGMVDLAVGTDAGGSVRIPAAIQGLAGFKTSKGLIPSPHSSELSGPGFIANSVKTLATVFDVVIARPQVDKMLEQPPASGRRWRIAYSRTLGGLANPTPEIEQIVRAVLDQVAQRQLGCDVEDAEPVLNALSTWDCCLTFYFAKLAALISGLQLSGDSADIDPGLKVLMSDPAFKVTSEQLEWARSQRVCTEHAISKFENDNGYDLIVTPTIGREPDFAAQPDQDFLDHGAPFWKSPTNLASHTYLFNLTGQPALTVPCGFTEAGHPVGLQLISRVGADRFVLEAGCAFEHALRSAGKTPEVILINGPSSAGKSTLARQIVADPDLSARVSDVRLVSFDDFAAKGMAMRHWSRQFVEVACGADMLRECLGPEAWRYQEHRSASDAATRDDPPSCALELTELGLAYLYATFQKWVTMLRCGISLVIDHYIMDPNWYQALKERFDGIDYKQTSVGLFCDTRVLQVREALRSQLEARVCGTANFSADRVHDVFRVAHGSDYDLKFRSDTVEEQLWADHEYENVVLNKQKAKTPRPSSSESDLALKVVQALNALRHE
jgi:aspartyl-tRNA(Asn)/glutamyl-tRNA(Gln) amidotransferase subunit A